MNFWDSQKLKFTIRKSEISKNSIYWENSKTVNLNFCAKKTFDYNLNFHAKTSTIFNFCWFCSFKKISLFGAKIQIMLGQHDFQKSSNKISNFEFDFYPNSLWVQNLFIKSSKLIFVLFMNYLCFDILSISGGICQKWQ